MTKRHGHKQAIRRLKTERNLTYGEARRAFLAGARPKSTQSGRQLAIQRANAQTDWNATAPTEPCTCPGGCRHGAPCVVSGCRGLLIHLGREPGLRYEYEMWIDEFMCHICYARHDDRLHLPESPWAADSPNGVHYYATTFDWGNHNHVLLTASACYLCGRPPQDEGLLCDRCAMQDYIDAGGMLTAPDELPVLAAGISVDGSGLEYPWTPSDRYSKRMENHEDGIRVPES